MLFTKIKDVKSPARGTEESAGLDLFVPNDYPRFTLKPGESINIPSGIKMVLEMGTVGLILNKSGVGVKGILVGAQVIDSDYRGEVHLNVHNVTKDKIYSFEPGQKLVQMLILNVELLAPQEISNDDYDGFSNTQRGTCGFGSTGA